MKKAIVRGNALLRVILPALLLVFGLQALSAQGLATSSATLNQKEVAAELMNVDFLASSEAQDVLILAYKNLLSNPDQQDMTPSEEVELDVRASYYEHLLGVLESGESVEAALSQSIPVLYSIIARYKIAPDPQVIFQQTVALLSQ